MPLIFPGPFLGCISSCVPFHCFLFKETNKTPSQTYMSFWPYKTWTSVRGRQKATHQSPWAGRNSRHGKDFGYCPQAKSKVIGEGQGSREKPCGPEEAAGRSKAPGAADGSHGGLTPPKMVCVHFQCGQTGGRRAWELGSHARGGARI